MFGPKLGPRLVEAVGGSAGLVFDLIERHDIHCDAVREGWIQSAHCSEALAVGHARAAQWAARGGPGRGTRPRPGGPNGRQRRLRRRLAGPPGRRRPAAELRPRPGPGGGRPGGADPWGLPGPQVEPRRCRLAPGDRSRDAGRQDRDPDQQRLHRFPVARAGPQRGPALQPLGRHRAPARGCSEDHTAGPPGILGQPPHAQLLHDRAQRPAADWRPGTVPGPPEAGRYRHPDRRHRETVPPRPRRYRWPTGGRDELR